MLKTYFKIAFRSLWRSKAFSAINILGLAIGIATCLLISLFVGHELSYDRFHPHAERIVRVVFNASMQGEKLQEAHVMPPVAQALLAEYPEVEDATRLRAIGTPKIALGEKLFRESSFAFADSNFFNIFSLRLRKGDPATALTQPFTLVISETTARNYFGEEDPMGQVLQLKDWQQSYTVSGVMADMPANGHFQFDLLGSMSSFPEANNPSWMVSEFYTYLLLQEGHNPRELEAKLPQLIEKYLGPQLQQGMGLSLAQFQEAGNRLGLQLQPLTSIHLHSDLMHELKPGGDIRYVYIFAAIALFMLLIACINFMNLSTAGASKRAKEVGVRKVLGSGQGQLIGQFLTESVLISVVALLLGLVLVQLALPLFNELAGKNLSLLSLATVPMAAGLLLFGLLVGVLAGSYPAFFLASFKPVAVLKGSASGLRGKSSLSLRSGLVVFQFCISICLMIGTGVVYQQLQYIQQKKLGYNKDQVLVLPEAHFLGSHSELFRQQLLQDSRVQHVSTSGYLPAGPSYNNNFFIYPNEQVSDGIKSLRYDVDEEYIPTLGMELVAGRNFSKEIGRDANTIILNETAAKAIGFKGNALEQWVGHNTHDGKKLKMQVIGIVKDFHFRSLHEPIAPLVLVRSEQQGSIIAKVQTHDMPSLLASLETKWKALAGGEPFDYSFLDERFSQTYETERRMGTILALFAGLTIFVACLGLLGLATFTAQQRTKEMGIRKVLGASVPNLVGLLSKDFLKLVLLATIIAFPIAWWVMQQWLQDFAYRIDLSLWIFLAAGILAAGVAFLTISFQVVKAATASPVKNLRTE